MSGVMQRNQAMLLFVRKIGHPMYQHWLLHAAMDVYVGELHGKLIYSGKNITFIEIFLSALRYSLQKLKIIHFQLPEAWFLVKLFSPGVNT